MEVHMSIADAFCRFIDQEHEIGMTENVQLGTINGTKGNVITVVVVASVFVLHDPRVMLGVVKSFLWTRRVAMSFCRFVRSVGEFCCCVAQY
jgi:hypothetical protein